MRCLVMQLKIGLLLIALSLSACGAVVVSGPPDVSMYTKSHGRP